MSGREKAVERLRAHEARRRAEWRPRISAEELAYLRGREAEVAGWVREVDRAIASISGQAEFHAPTERAA
jgi:hypothetical protein